MIIPVGPPIGTLFSTASIPFNVKPSCQLKTFHLLKKRKRTISKTSVKDISSSVSGAKRLKQEEDRTNSDVEETVTQCNASDDVRMLAKEHNNSNESLTAALNVSELYTTAVESFTNSDSTAFMSSQESVSKRNPPKKWRKRKRCNNYDDMICIAKKKLKVNSDKTITKSKLHSDKGKRLKGCDSFCSIL